MPGIVSLVAMISLDVTRGLVAAGYGLGFDGTRFVVGASQLDVAGATNANPIVITTAQPHTVQRTAHAVIAGVLGNTAANNADERGYPQAVLATRVDDTRLELRTVQRPTGQIVTLAGNGAYTSGGTFTPAMTDLGILLGREHISEQSAPPRIVMIPVGSKWGPKSVYHGASANTAERERQNQQRSIATEKVVFEVHTWGEADPPDPDNDFDATQVLYQQVIQSIHALTAGTYELLDGAWPGQLPNATQLVRAGHEHVFRVAIGTPILDVLLPYAPSDVAALPTTNYQPPGSETSEQGCSG